MTKDKPPIVLESKEDISYIIIHQSELIRFILVLIGALLLLFLIAFTFSADRHLRSQKQQISLEKQIDEKVKILTLENGNNKKFIIKR